MSEIRKYDGCRSNKEALQGSQAFIERRKGIEIRRREPKTESSQQRKIEGRIVCKSCKRREEASVEYKLRMMKEKDEWMRERALGGEMGR